MNRFIFASTAIALAGCATTQSEQKTAQAAGAPREKLAISNVSAFDLAACGPRTIELAPLNNEILTGALLSLGPSFQECLLDAKAREGATGDVKVKVSVSETGVMQEVAGTGISTAAKTCLENVLKKLPLKAAAPGAKPSVAEVPVAVGPTTVKMGLNVASDLVGSVRLAQTSFCECYAPYATKAPPEVKGSITLSAANPPALTLDIPADAELKTCLETKILALTFPKTEVQSPLPILLTNSYANEAVTGPAALQFQQLDGLRAQRTADILVLAGKRLVAAETYDGVVKAFKANKKATKAVIDDLRAKCGQVVQADDAWAGGLEALLDVYQRSLTLASTEKAKDGQWAQVETALTQQLTSTKGEVTRVAQVKVADLNACPKVK
jgi:hypothetical protein